MTDLITSPDQLCFCDSETRSIVGGIAGDLTKCGAYRYVAEGAFANIWTWCIGDDPVEGMFLDDGFDERFTWDLDATDELKRFHDRALKGEAFYVAWNMNFDRQVWNGPASDFPEMRTDMAIDAMVQAASSGLPTKLEHAAQKMGFGGKQNDGLKLIKKFAPSDGMQPADDPEAWERYKTYGLKDTDLLRRIFKATRPLEKEEWHQYMVSERINDRGMLVDQELCRGAAAVAKANIKDMNIEIAHETDGAVDKVTQVARMLGWAAPILERWHAKGPLVKVPLKLDDDNMIVTEEKLSMSRDRIEEVLVHIEHILEKLPNDPLTEELRAAQVVLVLRQYGGSNTPKKFQKILDYLEGGKLKGQYVFNGAPQTGRFSSRGVQIHNLARAHLGELENIIINLLGEVTP